MAKIPLDAPWRPDHPPLGNPGLLVARNCLPGAGHYRPMPIPSQVNANSFDGPAEGLWVAAQPNGSLLQFVAFDGHVYRIPGQAAAPVLIDGASYPYGYQLGEGERWRQVQYGPLVVITNYNDPIQSIDVTDLADELDDLDASAPKAKHIAVIRDFIVVANTDDGVDGAVGNRVRWHGIDATTGLPDPTEWSISLSTRADFQDVPDIGAITGLTGGAFGLVICERGIDRLDFGGQYVFNRTRVTNQIGCQTPGSVVQFEQTTFFLGESGLLYRCDGQSAAPINRHKNDLFLRGDIDLNEIHTMWAAADPGRRLIFWSYASSAGGRTLLCYSVDNDEFTINNVQADALGAAISFARDLDDDGDFADLDAMDIDLDDPRLWVGGALRFGIIQNHTINALIGSPFPARFQTGDLELTEGHRSVMNRALLHGQGGSTQIRVGTRERPDSDIVWSDFMNSPQSDGFWRFRAPGRYHVIDLVRYDEWRTTQAIEIWGAPLGVR